jgi:glyoxylase I family protein
LYPCPEHETSAPERNGFDGARPTPSRIVGKDTALRKTLGFDLVRQHLPAFGEVAIGDLKLILSGPGASGSRAMPDGRQQEPGGWNRVVLQVENLPALIVELEKQGARFRNAMEVGPGGKQIQVEDPDGNAVELFEPASQ